MIRINLLPGKEYRKRESRAGSAFLIVVPLLALALVAGIYVKNGRDLAGLRAQEEALTKQRASLDGIYKQVTAMEREKKEIAQRIAVIDRISAGRALAPKILYDLSSLATGNLWLKKLRKEDRTLDIEGRSVDNNSICTFVEGLSKLPYMADVELKSVEDVTEDGVVVKKFLVAGSVAS